MKIVRHTAPDMRQALRSIREQLGEEAVILSSRRLGQGVEVTAAVDFDPASLENAAPLAAAADRSAVQSVQSFPTVQDRVPPAPPAPQQPGRHDPAPAAAAAAKRVPIAAAPPPLEQSTPAAV